jgi:DNA-binding MarR family transcriptional regulator
VNTPPPADPPVFVLLNEVAIIEQLARARFEAAQPDGLLISHFAVLNHLARLGDGRTPVAIARALQVVKAAMTNTLQRLEARGLVRLAPDAQDRRSKRVFLTEAGRARREAAVATTRVIAEEVEAALPGPRLAETIAALRALRERLDRARDEVGDQAGEGRAPEAPGE